MNEAQEQRLEILLAVCEHVARIGGNGIVVTEQGGTTIGMAGSREIYLAPGFFQL